MVSFRKAFLLLAILVTIASVASAQVTAPALCTAYTSNVPNVRSEGVAEEVGQVVIECRGGTSAARGTTLNTINVQIFLDTQVTSRRTSANDNPAIEALLLIDDPTPAQVTSSTLCAAGSACPGTAVGGGIYNDPAGVIVNKNVYQGRLVSTNSVLWQGVPFDAPGTTPVRLLRIVNVRANANGLPLSTLLPTPVRMFISISGTAAPNLSVSQLNVAYLQKGLRFGSQDDGATFLQCETSEGSFGSTSSGLKTFRLRYRENFPTAFRDNNIPTGNQADLTKIYNTESMYYHPTVAAAWTGAGLGTQPTRLMATFTGIPTNVILRLPRTVTSGGDSIKYMQCFDAIGQNCSDALLGSGSSVEPTITGGTVTVVYEMTSSSSTTLADLSIRAELRWGPISGGIPGPPGTGPVSVTGSYAPISTTTASVLQPAPRFVIDPNDKPVGFTIAPCRTNLLFPYVTNQGGFDTGLVISNTSADNFGTVKQDGTCTLDYFGNINGNPIPDTDKSQTTEVITAGTQAIGLVSGTIKGTKTPMAGFQGYIIAKCNFQYAHGYAFLYTGGASFAGAQGYLALVLDGDKDYVKGGSLSFDPGLNTGTITLNAPTTRTKSISEVRGQ
jgi:hypothetical protein